MNILHRTVLIALAFLASFEFIFPPEMTQERLEIFFRMHDLVPQITLFPPANPLEVKFATGEQAWYGETITVLDCIYAPTLKFNDTDEDATDDSLYTLVFFNVYAGYPHFLYWMVNNFHHRNEVAYGGDLTVSYKYPNPPNFEAYRLQKHTMLLLVYRQNQSEEFAAEDILGPELDRSKFNLLDFLGSYPVIFEYPVAGNFFTLYPRSVFDIPANPPEWMRSYIEEFKKIDDARMPPP